MNFADMCYISFKVTLLLYTAAHSVQQISSGWKLSEVLL